MQKINELILADPGVRYWVKEQYRAALGRDPIDALNDARLLMTMLDENARQLLSS